MVRTHASRSARSTSPSRAAARAFRNARSAFTALKWWRTFSSLAERDVPGSRSRNLTNEGSSVTDSFSFKKMSLAHYPTMSRMMYPTGAPIPIGSSQRERQLHPDAHGDRLPLERPRAEAPLLHGDHRLLV